MVFATNQTDDLYGANNLNDSAIVNELVGDSISGKTIEINQDYSGGYTGDDYGTLFCNDKAGKRRNIRVFGWIN